MNKTKKTYYESNPRLVYSIRIALLAVAVSFLVLGIVNGGARDVFNKAIRICMECVGLG